MRAAVAALGDTHQRPRAADNRQQTRVPWPLSTPESAMSCWQLESSLNGSVIGCANDWCVIDACSERKRCVFAACAVTPRHCTLYHNKRTRPLTIHHFICFSLLFLLPVHLFCLSCPAVGLLSRFPLLPSAAVFWSSPTIMTKSDRIRLILWMLLSCFLGYCLFLCSLLWWNCLCCFLCFLLCIICRGYHSYCG